MEGLWNDILQIPIRDGPRIVNQVDALEIGCCDTGASAVSAVDQATIRQWSMEGLSESGLRHCPGQDERVSAGDPQEPQMTEAISETL